MKLNETAWQKLIIRWSELKPTPEVKLIAAIIAKAIIDERKRSLPHFVGGFWDTNFLRYSKIIGINPQFLIEQINRANDFVPKLEQEGLCV